MRRLLALLLLCPAPLVAQTADSVVCRACVPDSVHVDSTLVRVDTTITYTYRITYDTTYRDSLVPVTQPPVDPGPLPMPAYAVHSCSAKTEDGWTDRGDAAFAIVRDAAQGSVCEATFRQGMRGGTGPVMVNHLLPKSRTLVLSFLLWVSPNWQGHSSNVNKVFHLWINGGNRAYLTLQGHGAGPLIPQVNLQGVVGGSRNLTPNVQRLSVPRGEWMRWTVTLTGNRQGADGTVDWSVNGVLVGRYTGIQWTTGPSLWDKVSWNPTWGGTGDQLRVFQSMRVDDLRLAVGP